MLQYTVVARTWSTKQLPKYTALHVILLLYECLLQTVTYMEKKSFEIGVNAEWLKKQQHQIKYETILFLQSKDSTGKWYPKFIFGQLYLNLNSKVVHWQGSDQLIPQKRNETDQFENLALRYDHPVLLEISRYTDWLEYYF